MRQQNWGHKRMLERQANVTDPVLRLFGAVLDHRGADPSASRTAKLLSAGRPKIASKVGEEAIEVTIAAIADDREAVILESADLLYNLTVLWADAGISPAEIWQEMARREALYGIAEKLAKAPRRG